MIAMFLFLSFVEVVVTKLYTANKDFFKIWTPEMAWVLGFLAADGNVRFVNNDPKRAGRITVNIHQKDIDVLQKILTVMESTSRIRLVECKRMAPNSKKETIAHMCVIEINSTELTNDVVKLGITPKKSHTLQWNPDIPKQYISHFIRGSFEGDGWITGLSKNGSNLKACLAGNYDFIKGVSDNTQFASPRFCQCNKRIHYNMEFYNVIYNHHNAQTFLDYIYRESTESTRMNRKYETYQEVKSLIPFTTSSQFTEVHLVKGDHCWAGRWKTHVTIRIDGKKKQLSLKTFPTELDAAIAREYYVCKRRLDAIRNFPQFWIEGVFMPPPSLLKNVTPSIWESLPD
jgi:hypothetical protein